MMKSFALWVVIALVLHGGSRQLTLATIPDDATNKNATRTSSAPAVATVSSSGLVSGVGYGRATMGMVTEDGGFTGSCEVTVSIIRWHTALGAEKQDYANCVRPTSDGGYIACGYYGTVDWEAGGPQEDDGQGTHYAPVWAYQDLILTSSGGFLAVGSANRKHWNGASYDYHYPTAIVPHDASGLAATATSCFFGSVDGDADTYVAKLAANGQVGWQTNVGGASCDSGYFIAPAPGGGYVVAGRTKSSDLLELCCSSSRRAAGAQTFYPAPSSFSQPLRRVCGPLRGRQRPPAGEA